MENSNQAKPREIEEVPEINLPQGSFDPVKNIELSVEFMEKLMYKSSNRPLWSRLLAVIVGISLILGVLPAVVVIGVDIGGVGKLLVWLAGIVIGIRIINANIKE